MKIAYFVAEYSRFTGSQRSLLEILRHLKGHVEYVVIFPSHGKCVDIFNAHGISTKVIEAPQELNMFGKQHIKSSSVGRLITFMRSVVPYSRTIGEFLQSEKFDLIHHNTPRGLLMTLLAGRNANIPVITHIRGRMEVMGKMYRVITELFSDKLLLVSASLASDLSGWFHKKSFATTLYSICYDIYQDEPDTGVRNRLNDYIEFDVVFLILSSLVPFKGYHHLIDAIRIVNARNSSAMKVFFLAIGEQPDEDYRKFIEDRVTDYRITNFQHLGHQANPYPFYVAADAVVLPSVEKELFFWGGKEQLILGNEGLPRVIIEGMAFGKPVIGTEIAGVPELIRDGKNGFLVPPGDPERLADAMLQLINDPKLRLKMGRQGQERVRDFAPSIIIPQLLREYESVIAGRNSRSDKA